MKLHLDIAGQQFQQAQKQLTELLQKAEQNNGPAPLLTQALDELTNALEEVHVLLEELSEQQGQVQSAQAALSQERQQYFELFDLAPDGYIVTNTQGIIQKLNRAATTLLNRHQRLLVGKPLAALMAQADIPKFYTILNQLNQGQALQAIDLRLKSYQKQSLYASFTIAPIQNPQAQIVGYRWLFRDLTQQRKTTLALEESEAKYRAIVENQTELICRSLADGRLTFVNQAFCHYFERSSESMLGEDFFELIVETDQETLLKQMAVLDRLNHKNPVITLEHRVALSDGQIRWQSWTHRALFDRNGDFFQFQSAGRDITAQKQAEETLQERENQLRLMADALPTLLAYVNAKQQVLYTNRTQEHWLEKPLVRVEEHYLWDVLGPNTYQQIRIPIETALSGKRVTFEQEIALPTQTPFSVSTTFVPDQASDGQVHGFFALVTRLVRP